MLCQLQGGLILHNPLSHGRGVRIGDRNHVHAAIKVVDTAEVALYLVGIFRGHVVMDNPRQDAQLLLHRCMQACLHTGHNFKATLEQSQRRSNWGVCAHVANLDVSHGADATTFLDHVAKQLVQHARGFLVRHREQAVS